MKSNRFKINPKRFTPPASSTHMEEVELSGKLKSFKEQLREEIRSEFIKIKEEMKPKNSQKER
jgi:hypothetical protein